MQKKVIKRKSAPSKKHNNTGSTKEYSIKRKPQKTTKRKENTNIQIACWIGFILLLLLCYLKLGLIFTLVTAVGIGIIV